MNDGTMARLFKKAMLAPADDPNTQEELRRLTRLLGLQISERGLTSPWVGVDPLHDAIEAQWSRMRMPPFFEWVYVFTPTPIIDDGRAVVLCYIRRSRPTPNTVTPIEVPFRQVRAAEGFAFGVLGVVVPSMIDPSCWQITTAAGTNIPFMALSMRVQIGDLGDVAHEMTPDGPIRTEGPFKPRDPDEATLARAKLALTMIPKSFGGRPSGSGTFADEDELRAVIDPLVRELRGVRQHPSVQRVARMMPGDVDPKVLSRWVRRHIKLDWPGYLQTVR